MKRTIILRGISFALLIGILYVYLWGRAKGNLIPIWKDPLFQLTPAYQTDIWLIPFKNLWLGIQQFPIIKLIHLTFYSIIGAFLYSFKGLQNRVCTFSVIATLSIILCELLNFIFNGTLKRIDINNVFIYYVGLFLGKYLFILLKKIVVSCAKILLSE